MRTSNTRARKFRSTVGKFVMALVFASMIGGISSAPAFGRDDYRGGGYDQRNRYEQRQYERGGYSHGRRVYQHRTYYTRPVYAPPLDYYVPTPSPGISIVFPILIR